ncbi:MAG: hypothetical protein MUC74_00710 [Ideonella sp.]|jgi:hypothetical protein|nr:hypothetical protein [Ideonella sp.]
MTRSRLLPPARPCTDEGARPAAPGTARKASRLAAGAKSLAIGATVALLLAPIGFTPAQAQGASGLAIFDGADLALGERLIREHKCSECHAKRVGGDGHAIYRPAGRINTPGFLRGMVEQCNSELNLGLFPEEVTAVAAVLQRDHYRFR